MAGLHRNLFKSLCHSLGLFDPTTGEPINVTCKPSDFPIEKYHEVAGLQTLINELIHNASLDLDRFDLEDNMSLLLDEIRRCKQKRRIEAFILRSDYLLDSDGVMKQVEINTMSQSFLVFGPIVNRIHSLMGNNVLVSDSDARVVDFVVELRKVFTDVYGDRDTICLMIDNDTSTNSANYLEKMILIRMLKEKGVDMFHVGMDDLRNDACFDDGRLLFMGKTVYLVYYRWFYNIDHYDEESRAMRMRIECTNAITLPSVEVQILNSKTFQKIFCDRQILGRYIGSPERLLKHFCEFRPPSEYDGSEDYILKSVNEGGGFNIYEGLEKYKDSRMHVLMKKIVSPAYPNRFLRDDEDRRMVCEVGVFGNLISVDQRIVRNESCGYICRSKDERSREGGVCMGAGALDSIKH